jgi:glycosyltransferase involved in cell wall biosynthesis
MSKVSIVIPSYNHALFLKERLESILNQTFTDWEAIIIDDKSTDNSVEIITKFIKDYPEFKVKHFIINETNSGSGYKSWQKGIELATSEYIWIAETDDYSDAHFLEESVSILEKHSTLPLVFCTSNYVGQDGYYLYDSRKRTSLLGVSDDKYGIVKNQVIMNSFPFNPLIINGSSVVFRKPKNLALDDVFKHRQMSDLFFWTWLIQKADVVFLNKKLNYFRRHEDSTTTKIGLTQREILYKELIAYLNLYPYDNKITILYEKFIEEFWWPKVKKGQFSLVPLASLKNFNFFTLRMKFIKHLFRFVFSKF